VAGEVALEESCCVAFGFAFGDAAGDVVAGGGVVFIVARGGGVG
jgi:hypothetical protein